MLKRLMSRLDSLYSDAEDRCRARALGTVLAVLAAGTLLYLPVVLPLAGQQGLAAFAVVGTAGAFTVLGRAAWLLLSGHLRAAARFQAVGYWLIATVATLLAVGVTAGTAAVTVLIYLTLSAIALERRDIFVLTGLYLVSLVVVGLLQLSGVPPVPPAEATDLLQGVALGLAAVVVGGVLGFVLDQMSRAVRSDSAKAQRLHALLEIGQLAASSLDLEVTLTAVAVRTGALLGYEHVHVFLVDSHQNTAILRAATGPLGRELLKRGHAIRLTLPTSAVARAAVTRKPQLVEISPDGAAENADDLLMGMLSQAALPLVMGEQMLGVLSIQSTRADAFPPDSGEALQTLANLIAISVQNAQTFAAEATLLAQSSPIVRAMHELATTTEPGHMLDILRRYAMPDGDHLSLLQIVRDAKDGAGLVLVAQRDSEGLAPGEGDLPDLPALLGATPLVVADLNADSRLPEPIRAYARRRLRAASLVCLPLRVRSVLTGYLVIGTRDARAYSYDEVQTLDVLAGQIAVTLDYMSQTGQLSRSLDEATTLYSASQAMNTARTLGEVYAAALSEATAIAGADRATLYRAGPDPRGEAGYLETVAAWNGRRVILAESPKRSGLDDVPVLALQPRSCDSQVFNDIVSDQRLDTDIRAAYLKDDVNAVAVIPVCQADTWLGAMVLELRSGRTFSDSAIRLCCRVAELTAQAIDVQLVMQSAQQSAEREHQVRELLDRIRRAKDSDSVMQLADQGLSQLLNRPVSDIQQARLGRRSIMSPVEWQLVQDIDRQAQLVIASLTLLEHTQHSVEQEQVLGEITADLQRTVGFDDVMETAVEALQSVLGDYDISLRLVTQVGDEGPAEDSETDL